MLAASIDDFFEPGLAYNLDSKQEAYYASVGVNVRAWRALPARKRVCYAAQLSEDAPASICQAGH